MYFKNFSILSVICLASFLFVSCSDEYEVPDGVTKLTNDCIKRSLGPNVVGGQIEFAYAMALPREKGDWFQLEYKLLFLVLKEHTWNIVHIIQMMLVLMSG